MAARRCPHVGDWPDRFSTWYVRALSRRSQTAPGLRIDDRIGVTAAARDRRSVRQPPEHRAHAIERGLDRIEVGRADVAARSRDPQRRRELARGSGGAAEQVRSVEASPLPALADVERDARERCALLPQLRLEGSELFQHEE